MELTVLWGVGKCHPSLLGPQEKLNSGKCSFLKMKKRKQSRAQSTRKEVNEPTSKLRVQTLWLGSSLPRLCHTCARAYMREHTCSPSQDPRWCRVRGKPEPLCPQSLETAGGLTGHGGWELLWLAAQKWRFAIQFGEKEGQ